MDIKRPDWERIIASVEKSNYAAVKREGDYNLNTILKIFILSNLITIINNHLL